MWAGFKGETKFNLIAHIILHLFNKVIIFITVGWKPLGEKVTELDWSLVCVHEHRHFDTQDSQLWVARPSVCDCSEPMLGKGYYGYIQVKMLDLWIQREWPVVLPSINCSILEAQFPHMEHGYTVGKNDKYVIVHMGKKNHGFIRLENYSNHCLPSRQSICPFPLNLHGNFWVLWTEVARWILRSHMNSKSSIKSPSSFFLILQHPL